MMNESYQPEHDRGLIEEAVAGNKAALEQLIKRHQDYIYNISLRLFLDPDDALDATQEVLIKVITSLKSFRGESQFRTWLYKIAFYHFLGTPKKKMEVLLEQNAHSFAQFAEESEEKQYSEEEVEEVRILCSTAMLMCLSREQRLIYIVGEIFGADHALGAELFDITPANYRVKLHRAKTDLHTYVSGKCGLVNPQNPCRCPKKTRLFVERGIVDKEKLRFNADYSAKVSELVKSRKDEISDKIGLELQALFQDSPFQIKQELDALLGDLVK